MWQVVVGQAPKRPHSCLNLTNFTMNVASHPVHVSPLLPPSCEHRASPASRRRMAQAGGHRRAPCPGTHRGRAGNASEQLDLSSKIHFQSRGGVPTSKCPLPRKALCSSHWDASLGWLCEDVLLTH